MPPSVLFADDNPHAQRMGSQYLTDLGYEVTAVSRGEEVLDELARRPPDLLVLDHQLEGISGLDLCRQIRERTEWRSLPVILTVGALDSYDSESLRQAGASAVVRKPFALESLQAALQQAFSNSLRGEATLDPASSTAAGLVQPPPPSGEALLLQLLWETAQLPLSGAQRRGESSLVPVLQEVLMRYLPSPLADKALQEIADRLK